MKATDRFGEVLWVRFETTVADGFTKARGRLVDPVVAIAFERAALDSARNGNALETRGPVE
jgi:hypothetical protein